MSKLNDTTLKSLAKIGHGEYYSSTMDAREVNTFLSNIASLKKRTAKKRLRKSINTNNYTRIFLV